MLKTLRDLAARLVPEPSADAEAVATHTLELATAVLLVEVMRADGGFDPVERSEVRATLRRTFALQDDEVARLTDLAELTAEASTDLFEHTSLVDARFDVADKVRIVEALWRVAYADGRLREHERHLVWRIADLLHIPHGAYVNARLRAERDAGLGTPPTPGG